VQTSAFDEPPPPLSAKCSHWTTSLYCGRLLWTAPNHALYKIYNISVYNILKFLRYFFFKRKKERNKLKSSRVMSANGCEWDSKPCPHQPETCSEIEVMAILKRRTALR